MGHQVHPPPEQIYRSEFGFDFRYCRSSALLGKGAYFADNFAYSHKYAYSTADGLKQVFIAKVLTGKSFIAHSVDYTLHKPPLNPSGSTFTLELYDSVYRYANGSRVYVLYDHAKVYPSYIVT